MLYTILEALSQEGFLCEQASSYRKAECKIVIYEYDLLVIDINLPDGSGLDLIKLVKQWKPESGLLVISARNSLDNKIEGLELGANDYLTKPFDMAELLSQTWSNLRK